MPEDFEEDITLDFSDIKADEGTLVPKGWHDVEVIKVRLMRSKPKEGVEGSGGTPYLNFETKVVDGDYENRRLFYRAGMGSKKSKEAHLFVMGRLLALLHSFGIEDEKVRFIADKSEDNLLIEPDLTGLVAKALVHHRMYDGELREDVKRLVGYGPDTSGTPADQGEHSSNGSVQAETSAEESAPVEKTTKKEEGAASPKPVFK